MINNSRPLFDLFIKETCIPAINLKSPFSSPICYLYRPWTCSLSSLKKSEEKPPKLLKNKIPPIAPPYPYFLIFLH